LADPLASAVRFLRGGGALVAALLAITVWCPASFAQRAEAPVGSSPPGPIQTDTTGCAALVAAHPGAPCSFDFTQFRTNDANLDILAAKGIVGSGLFRGNVYVARNAEEANNLGKRLKPGDQLVLQNGVWRNAALSIEAKGTPSQPILIRGESESGVTLTGTSSVRLWGENLILRDLKFADGTADKDPYVVVRFGAGANQACNRCIVDHIEVDGFKSAPDRYSTLVVIYLLLQGRDITVANSTFSHKMNVGPVVFASHPIEHQCKVGMAPGEKCYQRLLMTNNRFSDVSKDVRQRRSPRGKFKIMEIGAGHFATASSFSVIQNNVFEYADGGTNTVDFKTSDVMVRRNRFYSNLGTLNLRSTNRVLIENNVFDGSERKGMGGVLIQGKGHWIAHNLFRNLTNPINDYHYPISMSAGLYEELADGQTDYARSKQIVIADNVFEHVGFPPIAMGVFPKPEVGRTLMPTDVLYANNVMSFAPGPSPPASPKLPADPSFEDAIRYVEPRSGYTGIRFQDNRVVP